jgi:hypothetical protein
VIIDSTKEPPLLYFTTDIPQHGDAHLPSAQPTTNFPFHPIPPNFRISWISVTGIVNKTGITPAGPVAFDARFDGKRGTVIIDSTKEPPLLYFGVV